MTTRLLVGDVFARMAELPDHSFDLIVTSPPFYGVRSYLPDDHPDKWREIGSEATVADYLDKLLLLTAEWRRLLAPHGSLVVELGDTYAGSGGAGGDYDEDGLREGQPKFRVDWSRSDVLPKSLCGIPDAYMQSLICGWNVRRRNAPDSPAGQWRIRNKKPWIRSNPPVGALGDKERPATSYITVACTSASRWFDLDAVRTTPSTSDRHDANMRKREAIVGKNGYGHMPEVISSNPGGAPPLDWWHPVDAVIDAVIDQRAGKVSGHGPHRGDGIKGRLGDDGKPDAKRYTNGEMSVGARGVHIRRALTQAGHLPPGDFYDVSPKGYAGAHYAVWPPELVRLLIDEMCPRRVCTQCGEPSRRLAARSDRRHEIAELAAHIQQRREAAGFTRAQLAHLFPHYKNDDSITAQFSNWERGKNIPSEGDWEILKHELGVSGEFDALIASERSYIEYEHVSDHPSGRTQDDAGRVYQRLSKRSERLPVTGWSECGHGVWRPGRILDPFSGSGTTLAVASGMGRDSVGIDLDPRNADLTAERVGMFLEVDYGTREATA